MTITRRTLLGSSLIAGASRVRNSAVSCLPMSPPMPRPDRSEEGRP
jgi:hypothetical protein